MNATPFPSPMSELPNPGQKVRWRQPQHAHAIGWEDAYGPGPFEVVRVVDKSKQDIPAAVILKTHLGEKEINTIWLAPVPQFDIDHIEDHIRERTWGKVRFLDVAVNDDGRVVVRGLAPSYYAKQLAIKAVAEVLPRSQQVDVLIEVR